MIEYTLYNTITPQTLTSSTDATPIVVTKTSHGLSTGDIIAISGHTTNVAANGVRKITVLTANTFSLQDPYTGANIAGSGGGAGSGGIAMVGPKVILTKDFCRAVMNIVTAGTATLTMKLAGSSGKILPDQTNLGGDTPNFGGTLSDTNFYNFIGFEDQDIVTSGLRTMTTGATGIAAAGADVNKTLAIKLEGLKYLCLVPTAWTQGSVTAKITLFNE